MPPQVLSDIGVDVVGIESIGETTIATHSSIVLQAN